MPDESAAASESEDDTGTAQTRSGGQLQAAGGFWGWLQGGSGLILAADGRDRWRVNGGSEHLRL
jgi:hypothetical protein